MSAEVFAINPVSEHSLETAFVKGGADGRYLVQGGQGLRQAAAAFSCLVAPVAGDKVLLSRAGGECFILAVLERDSADMTLAVPGDMHIQAGSGRLTLAGQAGVDLRSAKDISLTSTGFAITAIQGRVQTRQFTLRSQQAEACTQDAKLYTETLETVAGRVVARAKTLMRWVEGVETLQVGQLIQSVRETFTHRSHHAVITARKDVKIDAERIHMG